MGKKKDMFGYYILVGLVCVQTDFLPVKPREVNMKLSRMTDRIAGSNVL